MNEILKKLSQIGIVPVIKIDDVEKAVPLAKALKEGGLPCAEVTFRTAQGEEAIRRIAKEVPDVLVGAGTVLTTEQVDRAIAAGAKFIVSPGLNPKVVAYCIEKGIPVTPGCANPSDIEAAIELGLDVVKFFPAEQAGGLAYIKAISAPYPNLKFMPTGGVNEKNLGDYLGFEKILCCGGSWMVKADLINDGKFDEITRLAKQAVHVMLGFELAHIGINAANEAEAVETAKLFEAMFGFAAKVGNSSVFADKYVEVMKTPYLGKNGHIAIATNHISRAVAYLESRGFAFDESTAKKDAKGNLAAIYFKNEIAGFAVHLVQKKK
ncbi:MULTISPECIES: bifunctional 4-hydroxy-2-oxoglutarate aldolase/2-dehydro-3-deoxy-phosphogluconate aldolase [Anaerotruncus]|jgi:2-dehydro-3-deoxyphosphogluconate aldolase/(4S)-4-hydroxy-2-oxoglutarate aldolase|uniref:bifunctional 4-hydroxy-2-oxoglutarate aldolase/2-dehydro-3-deoxy-phosphogluconate aldolase n=2 Tax=Oscillospiraceae TaxID=216572 RepID=UPI0008317703|nr:MULTISPECIES: bifunctional 4-hydroxy-2-oxoglutarate aldolase/2-dehydro-3-deoxy-phosphogluconate aldolase [Anaerotruncus]RGX57049.1 keto-hydroxyglutarate-aldolase/keto-deoxy-phosphogluconate aldolase [Anaerotruncus sp. AF02-27]